MKTEKEKWGEVTWDGPAMARPGTPLPMMTELVRGLLEATPPPPPRAHTPSSSSAGVGVGRRVSRLIRKDAAAAAAVVAVPNTVGGMAGTTAAAAV